MASQDTPVLDVVRVPQTTAIAIEYPGYIRNVDRALQTLGGEAAIAEASSSADGYLRLRFRPGMLALTVAAAV